jgi:hypothetical protein
MGVDGVGSGNAVDGLTGGAYSSLLNVAGDSIAIKLLFLNSTIISCWYQKNKSLHLIKNRT